MRIFPTKRGWKRLGIALAILVAIALIANGFMAWRTEAQIQSELAEIRAAGHPATISDLAPPPIPAEKNAAAIVESLRPRIDEFAKEHAALYNALIPTTEEHGASPGEPVRTAEQIAAIRSLVEKYPDLESGIADAAACEEYASVADFSLGPQEFLEDVLDNRAQPFRSLARFGDWKMEVLIVDGQPARAAELGRQILRLTQLRDSEPFLVNNLVNVAVRSIACQRIGDALASGSIPREARAAIDTELTRQDTNDGFLHALTTERALAGSYSELDGLGPASNEANSAWLRIVGWPVKRFYLGALQSYDPMLEVASKPWYEASREMTTPDTADQSSGHGVLADLLQPALRAGLTAHARNIVMIRGVRIVNALGQYRDDHGVEAKGLEDLPLPREATIDPFTGKPLLLKHTDDGWLIYSVGTNRTDDGGNFTDQKDHGLGPRKNL